MSMGWDFGRAFGVGAALLEADGVSLSLQFCGAKEV